MFPKQHQLVWGMVTLQNCKVAFATSGCICCKKNGHRDKWTFSENRKTTSDIGKTRESCLPARARCCKVNYLKSSACVGVFCFPFYVQNWSSIELKKSGKFSWLEIHLKLEDPTCRVKDQNCRRPVKQGGLKLQESGN